MIFIILSTIVFLQLITYLVFFDVILSWLSLAGIRYRPKFLNNVLGPIYKNIRKYIPTRFGPFDFTAITVIALIIFIRSLLLISFPEVNQALSQITL